MSRYIRSPVQERRKRRTPPSKSETPVRKAKTNPKTEVRKKCTSIDSDCGVYFLYWEDFCLRLSQFSKTVGDGQSWIQRHLLTSDIGRDADRRQRPQLLVGKLRKVAAFGIQHFRDHVADFLEREHRRGQRVQRD